MDRRTDMIEALSALAVRADAAAVEAEVMADELDLEIDDGPQRAAWWRGHAARTRDQAAHYREVVQELR